MTDERDDRIGALLERHTAQVPPARQDWSRVTGRAGRRTRAVLRPALAVAGFAAVAGVLGVLLLNTPDGTSRRPAGAPVFGTVTEPGVAMTLRAVPFPASGLTDRQAAERAAAVITDRLQREGSGARTAVGPDGLLDVWIPVVRTAEEAEEFTRPAGLAVYDLRRGVVASGAAADVLRAAAALDHPGPPVAVATVDRTGHLLAARSHQELQRVLEGVDVAAPVTPIPQGYLLIVGVKGTTATLVEDDPVVRAGELLSARPLNSDPDALVLPLTDAGAERLRATEAGDRWTAVMLMDGIGTSGGRVVSVSHASGVLRLAAEMPMTADPYEAGVLPVDLAVVSQTPTGPPRDDRAGTPVTDVPAPVSDALDVPGRPASEQPVRDTLRLVVTLPGPDGGATLWTARTRSGGAVEVVADRASVATGIGGPGCHLTPAHPVITVCGSGTGHAYGRVDPHVVRVTGARAAAIGDGWFLVGLESRGGATLRAWDASGDALGSVEVPDTAPSPDDSPPVSDAGGSATTTVNRP